MRLCRVLILCDFTPHLTLDLRREAFIKSLILHNIGRKGKSCLRLEYVIRLCFCVFVCMSVCWRLKCLSVCLSLARLVDCLSPAIGYVMHAFLSVSACCMGLSVMGLYVSVWCTCLSVSALCNVYRMCLPISAWYKLFVCLCLCLLNSMTLCVSSMCMCLSVSSGSMCLCVSA
jgi:hypothetical protein